MNENLKQLIESKLVLRNKQTDDRYNELMAPFKNPLLWRQKFKYQKNARALAAIPVISLQAIGRALPNLTPKILDFSVRELEKKRIRSTESVLNNIKSDTVKSDSLTNAFLVGMEKGGKLVGMEQTISTEFKAGIDTIALKLAFARNKCFQIAIDDAKEILKAMNE